MHTWLEDLYWDMPVISLRHKGEIPKRSKEIICAKTNKVISSLVRLSGISGCHLPEWRDKR